MHILITGATGMTGAELLRQAVRDPAVSRITALVRRPLDTLHEKVNQVLHSDFLCYEGLRDLFASVDVCLWCLGISQALAGGQTYRTITHDYTVAAARSLLAANPNMVFGFLSSMGADTSGRSGVLFARVKGNAENSLGELPFVRLYIFRPGGILPVKRSARESRYKRLEILLVRCAGLVAPFAVVRADHLSRVMLKVVKERPFKRVFSHRDIRQMDTDRKV